MSTPQLQINGDVISARQRGEKDWVVTKNGCDLLEHVGHTAQYAVQEFLYWHIENAETEDAEDFYRDKVGEWTCFFPSTLLLRKRVNVLDKGWIELVDLMPHPLSGVDGDLAIVNAARVSFLGESKGLEKDKKLLFYLMQHQHTTPFEMVEFKFRVRAPLVTFWQWVRHRVWNVNAQSGRYVEFEENDFYAPSVWRKQSKDNKQASEGELSAEDGAVLTEALLDHYAQGYRLYEQALRMGVSKEMARFFLPAFSVYYTWVMKVDAHNLMHFLRLRMAKDAQYEIRVYANAIYEHFFKVALPQTAEAYEEYRKNE